MVRFPLAKVLLPAVLVSASIFTAMTLPFVLTKSRPIVIELAPIFSGEIEPIFRPDRKEVAIRYLGFVIVISVGAGLITAEMLRKAHSTRELAETQEQLSGLQKRLQEQEAELAAAKLLGISPQELAAMTAEFSDADHHEPTAQVTAMDVMLSPDAEIDSLSTATDTTELEIEPEILIPSRRQNHATNGAENGAIASSQIELNSFAASSNGNLASATAAQSFNAYQASHVRLSTVGQYRFAIRANGRYYTLFRTNKNYQQIHAIAERLQSKGSDILITLMQQDYAVWRYEPEAKIESAS
jgi:hypothetical protein